MWTYNNNKFEPDADELSKWVGFVYLITENDTNMKYIGKKLFWSTKKLPPLKGKKRKRTVVSQSDWKTYYGSSEELKLLIENNGSDNYTREILHLCTGKGEMSYLEAKQQFDRDVLLRDDYHNGIISCRINHRAVAQLKY
jgi:hypothetical protein